MKRSYDQFTLWVLGEEYGEDWDDMINKFLSHSYECYQKGYKDAVESLAKSENYRIEDD